MSMEKLNYYIGQYGIEAINLIIKRHKLSEQKRTYFGVRRHVPGTDYEATFTAEMEELTAEINAIDDDLFCRFTITKKESPTIIKVIKKCYPDGWQHGFAE